MTDRELLELAAKAEGRTVEWMTMYVEGREPETFSARWNPLTNDGDALRLAVKLRMLVDVPSLTQSSQQIEVVASRVGSIYEPYGDNPGEAARRAIVRAAAAIGKEM